MNYLVGPFFVAVRGVAIGRAVRVVRVVRVRGQGAQGLISCKLHFPPKSGFSIRGVRSEGFQILSDIIYYGG